MQNGLALIANLSAHALTEPLRSAATDLASYVERTALRAEIRLNFTDVLVELTLLLDQFLNQIPLLRNRMLRNARVFRGDSTADQISTSFDEEYFVRNDSPWRALWELRNASQHAILPTTVFRFSTNLDGVDRGRKTPRFPSYSPVGAAIPI